MQTCSRCSLRILERPAAFADNPPIEDELFGWTQGFMSGMNYKSETLYFVLNAKSIDEEKRFLRRYCDAHPFGDYLDAVLDLIQTLPTSADRGRNHRHPQSRKFLKASPTSKSPARKAPITF